MRIRFSSSTVLMFYSITLLQETSSMIHNVSLIWDMEGNVLCLKCYIKNIGLGAYFYGPKGDQKGHCNAPLLAYNINEVGKCDSGITQTILFGNNVLNELKIKLHECENGVWKCSHGVNRNEEDKQDVTMHINVNCPSIASSFWDRCLCAIPPLVIGYLLGYFIAKQIKHFRENKKDGMTYTLLIALWSFVVGFLEVFLPAKFKSKIESQDVMESVIIPLNPVLINTETTETTQN